MTPPGTTRRRGTRRRRRADERRRQRARPAAAAPPVRQPAPQRRRPGRQRRSGTGGPPGGPRSPRPVGGPDDGAGSISIGGILRRLGLVVSDRHRGPRRAPRRLRRRPLDGRDLVQERRLRRRVLDPPRGPGRAVRRRRSLVALVILLGNLWLAGRLAPPPDPERPGRLRTITDRLTEAQRQAERNARMSGGQGGPFGPGGPFGAGMRSGRGEAATFGFDAGRHARPRADGDVGHRGLRGAACDRHRRRDLRRLGHDPAVGEPGAVLDHRHA